MTAGTWYTFGVNENKITQISKANTSYHLLLADGFQYITEVVNLVKPTHSLTNNQ